MTPDLNTPKGIRALADSLQTMAENADCRPAYHVIRDGLPPVTITAGRFTARIHNCREALQTAAEQFRKRASQAGKSRGGQWGTPTTHRRQDEWKKLDAVRVYGDPETALQAIERQLAAQSADMEPADVKRCERAAAMLRERLDTVAAMEAATQTEMGTMARIESARPATLEDLKPGTEVIADYGYRIMLGTVQTDPQRGAVRVELTHVWQSERVGTSYFSRFVPVRPKRVSVAVRNVKIPTV